MQNVSLLWDGQWFYTLRQEKRTDLHTPCHFWYLIPPIFSLFASYWPIYSLLRVKIHNIKKSVSHCLLFQKWCTCQLPWGKGRRVLLHLPFFDKHTASLVSFFFPPSISLFPSPSLVFTFPLLKCEMRGGSQDNWPCVSWAVWSRNAAEATHLRAAQQTVKCSTGGRTRLQRERGTRAV